jgi:hypothetical protein
MSDEIILRSLDGSNPLAFLAALGTLRLLTLETQQEIQLRWERLNGFWRPELRGIQAGDEELCEKMAKCSWWAPAEEFVASLGKNITVPKDKFKPFVNNACDTAKLHDRRAADFATAFGCEVCEEEDKDRIEYTDFCFITGSGHQDFLGTISALAGNVTSSHLYDALFGEWKAEKGLSMRWDPSDAAEYALRWDDPGPKGAWAVWGANRLATEALPFFPTVPASSGLQSTGFSRRNRHDEFTWPIWEHFIGFASVRSLVALTELQKDAPKREILLSMGIREAYRAQRVRIPPQGANFKVSFRPARTV